MRELPAEHYELLIRWVDGVATPEQQRQAAELAANDPDASAFVEQLRHSQLPFATAFEPMLDDTPASLAERIQALPDPAAEPPPMADSAGGGFAYRAVAAALMAGVLLGGIATTAWQSYRNSAPTLAQSPADEQPVWVQLIADYHSLYVRETVASAAPVSLEAQSARVSELLGAPVQVPDLSASDYNFRRAQQLGLGEQTLVQMVYLPESEKPLAVCVLRRSEVVDQPVVYDQRGDVQIAWWQSGEYAVAIVGDTDGDEMRAVAEQVRLSLFAS